MYRKILVTLDLTDTDRAIMEHVKPLAQLMRIRVVFLHVMTSAPANYHGSAAAGKEIEDCQADLNKAQSELGSEGHTENFARTPQAHAGAPGAGTAADQDTRAVEFVFSRQHWVGSANQVTERPDLSPMGVPAKGQPDPGAREAIWLWRTVRQQYQRPRRMICDRLGNRI